MTWLTMASLKVPKALPRIRGWRAYMYRDTPIRGPSAATRAAGLASTTYPHGVLDWPQLGETYEKESDPPV